MTGTPERKRKMFSFCPWIFAFLLSSSSAIAGSLAPLPRQLLPLQFFLSFAASSVGTLNIPVFSRADGCQTVVFV